MEPGRGACVAALSLLLAGCTTARIHRPATPLELLVQDTVLAVGDALEGRVTLRNPEAGPLRLRFRTSCPIGFFVQRADGDFADPPGGLRDCPEDPTEIRLAPGATSHFAYRWVPRESGVYRVYTILAEHDEFRGGRRDFKLGHRSNELRVHVRGSRPIP